MCPWEHPSSSTEAWDTLQLVCATVEDTVAFAKRLARLLRDHDVVYLHGPLGAGKTVVAKAMVEELGAAPAHRVLSPSFTLLRSYGDRVHHVDLYRIATPWEAGEVVAMVPQGILLVEWPERGEGFLPAPTWVVTLQIEGDGRLVTIRGPLTVRGGWGP